MLLPGESHFTTPDSRGFSAVDTWVFDLDNTLYPSDARVWPQVDERITLYVMRLYGLDAISARALQKHFYHRYGTTLKALMVEEGVDPHDFLDFAHDIDHSTIKLDESLGTAIEHLPGRKLIFTNGSRAHAERVAGKLGLLHLFEDIFDIVAAGYVPKPTPACYDQFLKAHGVAATTAAMFEDMPHNLEAPHALGMTTVLVRSDANDDHPIQRTMRSWQAPPPHVHHMTFDLLEFLAQIGHSGVRPLAATGSDESDTSERGV